MTRFAQIPTFDQNLAEKGITSKVWYFFFQNLYLGNPPASESPIVPAASPFTFVAPRKGFVIVQGGTVSMIQWARTPGTNHATGQTAGVFPLSAGDGLVVTYSATPNLTFVPQ